MKALRVLVVEDEMLIALYLEGVITEVAPAVVVIKASVAETKQVLQEAFDFAFLDVDVTNGKTFEIATLLKQKRVPFAFVSGSSLEHLPDELRRVLFIAKPFFRAQIAHALLARG